MYEYPRSTSWPYVIAATGLFVFILQTPYVLHSHDSSVVELPLIIRNSQVIRNHVSYASPVRVVEQHVVPSSGNIQKNQLVDTGSVQVVRVTSDVAKNLVAIDFTPVTSDQKDIGGDIHLGRLGEFCVLTPETNLLNKSAPTSSGIGDTTAPTSVRSASRITSAPSSPFSSQQGSALQSLQADVVIIPKSKQLYGQLLALREDLRTRAWADSTMASLELLVSEHSDQQIRDEALNRISDAVEHADRLTLSLGDNSVSLNLRYARHTLGRHSDIWQLAQRHVKVCGENGLGWDRKRLLEVLKRVENELDQGSHQAAWQDYLLVDPLSRLSRANDRVFKRDRLGLADRVMANIQADHLSVAQRRFLQQPAFQSLIDEMNRWSQSPQRMNRLLQAIENYEATQSIEYSRELSKEIEALSLLRDGTARILCGVLRAHYLNANVRVAVSEAMLNRLLPSLQNRFGHVNDTILGAQVRGRSRIRNRVVVRLEPDSRRARLRLESHGIVRSTTASLKGPVTMFSRGQSSFEVVSYIFIDAAGIHVGKTYADADSRSWLTGVQSEYDNVPLLGWYIRNVAREEHNNQRSEIRRHVSDRVMEEAKHQFDMALSDRLSAVKSRVRSRLVSPMRQLGVTAEPLECRSTEDRLVARARVSHKRQLGAHTPRPRARTDSLLSFQIHETALNNPATRLGLAGLRASLPTLLEELASRLNLSPVSLNANVPRDIVVQLAAAQPLRFDFDNGHVELTLRIAELVTPRRKWADFVVRARYRAALASREVELYRNGSIQLIGKRFNLRDQVAVRGIFTRMLSKNQRIPVLRGRLADHPRMDGLAVTQFIARDGWIGMSIGRTRSDVVASSSTNAGDKR